MNRYLSTLGIVALLLFLPSCGTKRKAELYSWYGYSNAMRSYSINPSYEKMLDLRDEYEKMIHNQRGKRKTVPPGVYADYGYLLLKTGNRAEGVAALRREQELYPESRKLVEYAFLLLNIDPKNYE